MRAFLVAAIVAASSLPSPATRDARAAGAWPGAGIAVVPITCDVTFCDSITAPAQRNTYSFTAASGEIVSISVTTATRSGANFQAAWRLLDSGGNPVGSLASFTIRGANAASDPLNAAASPYRIEVGDSGANDIGRFCIHLQRLTASTACENVALACDATGSGSIDNALDTDLYSFTVANGEIVSLNVARVTPVVPQFSIAWRLVDAAGGPVAGPLGTFSFHGADVVAGPLATAGNPYRVEIGDDGADAAGGYRVHLQRLTSTNACEALPLACDATRTETLADPADTDLFTFQVASPEIVSLSVVAVTPVNPNFQPAWRLVDGAGNLVSGWDNFAIRAKDTVAGPLPTTGNPYRVEVGDLGGDDTGTYRIHMQRLTALGACEATPLACDVTRSDSLQNGLDTDLYRFNVANGEIVSINVTRETPAMQGFQIAWRVVDATGAPVDGTAGSFSSHGADVLVGPLGSFGNPYRIEVGEDSGGEIGRYRIHLQRPTSTSACEGTALACDVTRTDSLGNAVDTDLFTFSAASGEIVSVSVVPVPPAGANFQAAWRLLDHNGNPVAGWDNFAIRAANAAAGPLGAAGNPYRIEVGDLGGDDTGFYRIHLQRLASTTACEGAALACDVTRTDSLQNVLDTDLFTFDVADGEIASLSVARVSPAAAGFNPAWRIVEASGVPVSSGLGSFAFRGADIAIGPFPSSGNPYRVEIGDDDAAQKGRYLVHLQRLASASACEGAALACDVTRSDSLQNAVDTDLFSFNAVNGEIVSLSVVSTTPAGPSFQAAWRLVDPSGDPVAGWDNFTIRAANTAVGPLASAGSPYRVEVGDLGGDDTGHYKIHMQRLTSVSACGVTALSCDSTLTATVSDPLDTDLFSFNVTLGEIVSVSVARITPAAAGFQPAWRVVDAAGNPVGGGFGSFAFRGVDTAVGPLPSGGNPYRIEVGDDDAGQTGSYRIHLQRLTTLVACSETRLACGGSLGGNLSDPLDTDLFRFSAFRGETVSITAAAGAVFGPNFQAAWRLVDGLGDPVAGNCGNFTIHGAGTTCGPLPPGGNPFRIELGDFGGDDTGTYTVSLGSCDPTAVPDAIASPPAALVLEQNEPNPFNPITTIEYALPAEADVRLRIYDLAGRHVETLVEARLPAGPHRVTWDAGRLPSGVYVYELRAGDAVRARKLVLAK